MEPLHYRIAPISPYMPSAGRGPLLTARAVAIIFKERRYDTGTPKTWWFTNIDHIDIAQGRVHLWRDAYGLVCDVPVEEVAQVCTTAEGGSIQAA